MEVVQVFSVCSFTSFEDMRTIHRLLCPVVSRFWWILPIAVILQGSSVNHSVSVCNGAFVF